MSFITNGSHTYRIRLTDSIVVGMKKRKRINIDLEFDRILFSFSLAFVGNKSFVSLIFKY